MTEFASYIVKNISEEEIDNDSSSEEQIVYEEYNDSSFVDFFSHMKSPMGALKKTIGDMYLTVRGFHIPSATLALYNNINSSEHYWRIYFQNTKITRTEEYTSYTSIDIPWGNCWYDSLSDTIECRYCGGGGYSGERFLFPAEVKTVLELFFTTLPVSIIKKPNTY